MVLVRRLLRAKKFVDEARPRLWPRPREEEKEEARTKVSTNLVFLSFSTSVRHLVLSSGLLLYFRPLCCMCLTFKNVVTEVKTFTHSPPPHVVADLGIRGRGRSLGQASTFVLLLFALFAPPFPMYWLSILQEKKRLIRWLSSSFYDGFKVFLMSLKKRALFSFYTHKPIVQKTIKRRGLRPRFMRDIVYGALKVIKARSIFYSWYGWYTYNTRK